MPYSPELGMRVYDPREGQQYGLQVGETITRAFQQAQQNALRKAEMGMDQQKLAMLQAEVAQKARATQLKQLGMDELDDLVNKQGLSFKDAFFKVSPKLFADNPQALGTIIHQDATEKATEAYRDALSRNREDILTLKMQEASTRQERDAAKQQLDLLKLQQTASDKAADRELRATQAEARLDAARNKVTPQEQERDSFAKLVEEKSVYDALVKDNPEDPNIKRLQRETNSKLELMKSQHKAPMTGKLEVNPDGTVSMSFGEGTATVGTQTATQGELANIKNSIVQIDQAANVLTEKDLGVAGNIWDSLVNRWVTQLVPGAGDPTVSSNRAQLQKAVDSYLQSQQSRGRLSAAERQEVRNTLVTQNLGESLPRAQEILHTMGRIQKFEAIARAKTGQQALQPWMFNNLSQEEIRQLFREKVITEPEFFEWASKAPFRRWAPPSQTMTPQSGMTR